MAAKRSGSEQTKKHPFNSPYTRTTALSIGNTKFVVYTDLLVGRSSYFRGALTGSLSEAESKSIVLDSSIVTEASFDLFVNWLYTGEISADLTRRASNAQLDEGVHAADPGLAFNNILEEYSIELLIQAYRAGDYLRSEGFRNHIITFLAHRIALDKLLPCSGDVELAYENTSASSPLRRLLADCVLYEARDGNFKQDELLPDMQQYLLQKLFESRSSRLGLQDAPYYQDICAAYHEHVDTHKCSGPIVKATVRDTTPEPDVGQAGGQATD